MPGGQRSEAPRSDDPRAVALFRDALRAAGFTPDGVKQAVVTVARGQDDSDSLVAALARLFVLHHAVPTALANRALAPLGVKQCAALGLVELGDDSASASVELTPEPGDFFFAADWPARGGADRPFDQVMSPARSTRLLAGLTIRRQGEIALDLGTGCGYQAILAARHARHVVATDATERALAFTRFNALLNGVTNLECRPGDWFEPVEGESFDLLMCNPPYVISPERGLLYRDDQRGSGQLSRSIVEAAPRHLRADGLAHVLVGWTHGEHEHWADPLQEWVGTTGCDAWLLREASYDPPSYAALWNAELANDHAAYARAIERWTRYFAERGIARLADGAVVLRRRDSPSPRVRFDQLPAGDLPVGAADDLAQRMAAEDQLEQLDDPGLSGQRLVPVPAHRLEQVLRHGQGGYHIVQATLILEAGLGSTLSVNSLFVRLLSAMDGTRTLAEVLTTAMPPGLHGEAANRFRIAALPAIRHAVAHGFLTLAP